MASKQFGSKTGRLPHLTTLGKGGVGGEVGDLRKDVEETISQMEVHGYGLVQIDEFENLVAPSANAIKTSFASAATLTTLVAADMNGAIGDDEMIPPRVPSVTTTSHANIDAVLMVLTGQIRDEDGNLVDQTDSLTLTDGGGVTQNFTKAFSKITGGSIPAQGGASGALTIGISKAVGLSKPMRNIQGAPMPLKEVAAGAVATTGTFVSRLTATPHGTYSPSGTPGGTDDYAVIYLVDPTA
jgi:hypothetical protein